MAPYTRAMAKRDKRKRQPKKNPVKLTSILKKGRGSAKTVVAKKPTKQPKQASLPTPSTSAASSAGTSKRELVVNIVPITAKIVSASGVPQKKRYYFFPGEEYEIVLPKVAAAEAPPKKVHFDEASLKASACSDSDFD